METVYEPTVPAEVALLSLVVGFNDVLQHTPRSVTVSPPSATTTPLPVAVVSATLVTGRDSTVGAERPWISIPPMAASWLPGEVSPMVCVPSRARRLVCKVRHIRTNG